MKNSKENVTPSEMQTTSDIYFTFTNHWDSSRTFKIKGFNFDNEIPVEAFQPALIPANTRRVLLCRCGSNNWRDDGRWVNEYTCDSCDQHITVY